MKILWPYLLAALIWASRGVAETVTKNEPTAELS